MAECSDPNPGGPDPTPSSPEAECRHDTVTLGTITWTAPLDWLEEILPGSPVLANLRRSLSCPPVNACAPASVARMPALPEACGSTPSGVTPPTLHPAESSSAALLSPTSARVLMSPPDLPEGNMNSFLMERMPISLQGEFTGTSTSVASVTDSMFPSNVSGAGGSTLLVEETYSLPASVASPAPCESQPHLRELDGNILEESRPPILQQDEAGTGSPVSVASAAIWMPPTNPAEVGVSVPSEEKASILDVYSSTPLSAASAPTGASSPKVLEDGTHTSAAGKDSTFRQQQCTSTPLSVPSAATRVSPPNPSEFGEATSTEGETASLQRDKCTAVPVSVASQTTCESESNLLEVDRNFSKEEKASVLQQEGGISALLSVASAGTQVSPVPNVPETEFGTSVLQKQGELSSTPLAAAWMSALDFSDTGGGPSTEVIAPTSCPGAVPGSASLGCWCHGAWTSPLSLLESEAGGTAEERAPAFQLGTGSCVNKGPQPSAAWATPLNLPAAKPNTAVASSVLQARKGSPVSMASAATWTSPPSLLGVGVNTSPAEKATTKDNTAETDSLLWRCPRDQLSSLSRAELEGRLESSLIIMEALSRQMRAYQDLRAPGAQLGPADQRDAGTQMPHADPKEEERLYHDLYEELRRRYRALRRSRESERDLARQLCDAVGETKVWISDSGKLLGTVDAAYVRIQKDRKSLGLQQKELGDLLSRCRNKLQESGQKQAEMEEEMKKALRVKEAAEMALESVRDHAGKRIRCLEQSLESQKHLHALLREANQYKADLFLDYNRNVEEMDRRATTLRDRWIQMQHDYETFTSMATRCLLTTKNMAAEVEAAREEVAQHREVCRKLEERTVEVVEALGRVNELTEANAGLERDLAVALKQASVAECEQETLLQEKDGLSQELAEAQSTIQRLDEAVARLSREKERAERERDSAQRDAREVSDCREFIEQENGIARRQLAETEEELKSNLAALRERSTQLEDLKDAYQALQEECDSLRAELAVSKAETRSAGTSMEALSESLLDIRAVHSHFLETADFLRAVLRGEAVDATQRNSFCTPARPTPCRLGSSFVETVLQAVAKKDSQTPGLLSKTTAFTKATPARPPTTSEFQENFSACVQDFQDVASQIRFLISQRHEAALEEAQSLKAETLRLKRDLESLENQLQAEKEAGSASVAKLNKALHVRIQNEKELQNLMRKQEERLRMLSDQSRDVALLQEEVSQLKYALQKSETETTALWEELRGKKPADADWVQEKIWLRQEVGKLRELLLHKDEERAELLTKYLCQVRSLEGQLYQAKQGLRRHEKAEAELKEALSALPPDVSATSAVRRLLERLS